MISRPLRSSSYIVLAIAIALQGSFVAPTIAQQRPPATPGLQGQPSITAEQRFDAVQQRRTDAALRQAEGDYGPVPTQGELLPLGVTQPAWDNPKAAPDQASPGVKRYSWSQDIIMRIRVRQAMITTLYFPAWETIEEVYLGDPQLFDAKIISPTVVIASARHPGADTNLLIRGRSGNIYNAYLRGEGATSRVVTDLQVYIEALERQVGSEPAGGAGGRFPSLSPVSTLMPQGPNSRSMNTAHAAMNHSAPPTNGSPMPGVRQPQLREIPFDPTKLVFDLALYAPDPQSRAIAPARVFRDDVRTYIDFGENADSMPVRPVVSLLIDGIETPVDTFTAGPTGNIIVVGAIGDLVLRNGNKIVCIKRLEGGKTPATETRAILTNPPKDGMAEAAAAPAGAPRAETASAKPHSPAALDFSNLAGDRP
jgi:ComB9 competence protein